MDRLKMSFRQPALWIGLGLIFLGMTEAFAVREASANANMIIRKHLRNEDFARAALWQEAAARAFDLISSRMNETIMDYCRQHDRPRLLDELRAYERESQKHQTQYLQAARENRKKEQLAPEQLRQEKQKINAFFVKWVSHYPDHFYAFGFYNALFGERIGQLKDSGRLATALQLEAEAAELCAHQYDRVVLAFFREQAEKDAPLPEGISWDERVEQYENKRDLQLKRASRLRALAENDPDAWPAIADQKEISDTSLNARLTAEQAEALARKKAEFKEVLERFPETRMYPAFQGHEWTVSLYAEGWRHLGIAFIDDQQAKVTDVLLTDSSLEPWSDEEETEQRETEREQALRLTKDQVRKIVADHPRVRRLKKAGSSIRLAPYYHDRYQCWIVEIIHNDREIGIVSVRDETGKVLEVDLPGGSGE